MRARPELLAPVGSPEALTAAVRSGADAVYLGTGSFNARRGAAQFSGEALSSAIRYCHERGVKVYVTLNTMVREDELEALERDIRMIGEARADAVLVQDLGVVRLVREQLPDMPLHASTQLAAHNRSAVALLARQGFERVVLAREMSIPEIAECAGLGTELEVFVHGALCVACSGQCLLSGLVGGRSGNRGRCAQPCRREYSLDGIEGYLLSTRDLCGLEQVRALAEIGVDSLKLEGRLKRPEYVSAVTAAYRHAIDEAPAPDAREALAQLFNRGGFTTGYLTGVKDTELMYRVQPNHVGVPVAGCSRNDTIRADRALLNGDALVLRRPNEADRPIRLQAAAGETVPCPGARRGDTLVRLVSEAQLRDEHERIRTEYKRFTVDAALEARIGSPVRLTLSEPETGHSTCVTGAPVEAAKTRGTDPERLTAQLRKTGDTPYRVDRVALSVDENAFLPAAALNALRREALEALTEARLPAAYRQCEPLPRPAREVCFPEIPKLAVESGDPAVLCRAAALGADRVIFTPADVRPEPLRQAIDRLPEGCELRLPPVLGEKSLRTLHTIVTEAAKRFSGTWLSNIAHFELSWPGRRMADYTLNAANRAALDELRDLGCELVAPSVELNTAQLAPLDMPRELIVHGRLTLMYLRHCPYRAAHELPGTHAACRHCDGCAPADRVEGRALTDRTGAAFPLHRLATPEGCILRLCNSVPLMLLRRAQRLPTATAWRLCLETVREAELLLPLYRAAAQGEDVRDRIPPELIENTTTGHLFRGVE